MIEFDPSHVDGDFLQIRSQVTEEKWCYNMMIHEGYLATQIRARVREDDNDAPMMCVMIMWDWVKGLDEWIRLDYSATAWVSSRSRAITVRPPDYFASRMRP